MDKRWRMLVGAVLLFAMWPVYASPDYLGEKECYACHKDKKRSYLEGVHGKTFTQNARDDIQARGCEACHGPGSEHVKLVGDDNYKGPLKIQSFSKKEPATAQEQNGMCLVCHQGTRRTHWQGSVHELAGLACSSCHTIHNPSKTIDPSVWGTCHLRQRALMQQVSHMPMREGILTCMDCHNPHGGDGPHLLNAASTNDVCYRCTPRSAGRSSGSIRRRVRIAQSAMNRMVPRKWHYCGLPRLFCVSAVIRSPNILATYTRVANWRRAIFT